MTGRGPIKGDVRPVPPRWEMVEVIRAAATSLAAGTGPTIGDAVMTAAVGQWLDGETRVPHVPPALVYDIGSRTVQACICGTPRPGQMVDGQPCERLRVAYQVAKAYLAAARTQGAGRG